MSEQLRLYGAYKKADLLWLDSVPSHWEIRKIKYLFNERMEKGYPDEPLLAATQTKGVVPKHMYEIRTVTATKDLHLLKLVEIGDFVISLRSFQGGIELAYYRGIISPAYTVMIPKNDIQSGYFKHLAKSKPFLELLKMCVTGIREGQNIDYSILKNSLIPLPPRPEQDQIVRYLDYTLAKIARFIRAKKKLIEVLKEQKQAIINQAVTKGIDPNAKMKPSGVAWLGDVPEGWEVCRLKSISMNIGDGLHGTPNYSIDGYYYFINGNNLGNPDIQLKSTTNSVDHFEYQKYKIDLNKNAILISLNGTIGNLSFYNDEPIVLSKSAGYVNLKSGINKHFVSAFLQSDYIQNYFKLTSSATTINNLSLNTLRNTFIFYPPLPEQQAIVTYIESKTKTIETTIATTQKEIDLITEYRRRLISDVVTGKVDVRGVAVGEVVDEVELEDLDEDELYNDVTESEELK